MDQTVMNIVFRGNDPLGEISIDDPGLPFDGMFTTKLLHDDFVTKSTLKNSIGIYLLINYDYEKKRISSVHVGESGEISTRLNNYNETMWHRALIFYDQNLRNNAISSSEQSLCTEACLFLESQLIDRLKCRHEFLVTPAKRHRQTTINPFNKKRYEDYLHRILLTFDILNNDMFYSVREHGTHLLILNDFGIKSFCSEKGGKYILHKESIIRKETNGSLPERLKRLREDYISRGIIGYRSCYLKVLEDIEFESASYSASFVLGTKVNGRTYWQRIEGH